MGNPDNKYNVMLSIAGSDSSAGAGVQADIKTAAALDVYAMTVITSVTAQSSQGVAAKSDVSTEMIRRQLEAVLSDEKPAAVKTGMLPTPEIIETVANVLRRYGCRNIVVDPLLISSSGFPLVDRPEEAADAFRRHLFPIATLITPNLPEASFLSGQDCPDPVSLPRLLNASAVLLKGGHSSGDDSADLLICNGTIERYATPRVNSRNTHGTGCVLSAAIASFLARGMELRDAVGEAKKFIYNAITEGASYTFGKGTGPLYLFKTEYRNDYQP